MYVDTGQGTAQGLDNPTELPVGNAVPCHKLDSLNTSADLPKKNAAYCSVGKPNPAKGQGRGRLIA